MKKIENWKISKTLFGHKVNFKCPQCKAGLVSKLDEAGNVDQCPECGVQFKLPGESYLAALKKDQELDAKEKQEARENAAKMKAARKAEAQAEKAKRLYEREQQHKDFEKNDTPSNSTLSGFGGLAPDGIYSQESARPKVKNESMKGCPYCHELILVSAIKCRFCGEFFDSRDERNKSTSRNAHSEKRKTHPLVMFTAVLSFLSLFVCCGGLGGGRSSNTPSGQGGGGTGSSYSSTPRLISPDTDQWLAVNTEAHWGPSEDAKVVGKMNRGAVVTVAKDDGSGWVEVYGFAAAIYKSSSWIRYPDEFLDIRQNVFVRKKHLTPSPPGF